jgi:hypothetical protein
VADEYTFAEWRYASKRDLKPLLAFAESHLMSLLRVRRLMDGRAMPAI